MRGGSSRLTRQCVSSWGGWHGRFSPSLPAALKTHLLHSSSFFASDTVVQDSVAADPKPGISKKSIGRRYLRVISNTLGLTLAAGVAGCTYVTLTYDTDTISKKIDEIRSQQTTGTDKTSALGFAAITSSAIPALLNVAQFYIDTRSSAEEQIRSFSAPSSDKLLPDLGPGEQHIYTLVLDLNDTLVHAEWKRECGWRTFKRPGVDAFLERMAQFYEIVVFSDQLLMSVDPLLDRLDRKGYIRYRLYRDATQYSGGHYLRDLSKLNRDPARVIYVTAHPEGSMQKEHVVSLPSWKPEQDTADTALLDLLPFFEVVARQRPADVRTVLASYEGQHIPTAFKERTKDMQRKLQERKQQNPFFRSIRT